MTGGTRGIGFAIARELIDQGCFVVIAGRNAERVEWAQQNLKTHGSGHCVGVSLFDIGDREASEAGATRAVDLLGGIDIVINNAGITSMAQVLDLEPVDAERIMAVNYFGALWVSRTLAPHLRDQGDGRLAFVSSLASLIPIVGLGGYSPTKAAIDSLAETMRQELAPHGVRVTR